MMYWVTLVFVMFSAFSNAENKTKDLYNLSLQELTQVRITGSTLTPETLSKVPSSVTVFSHQQIQRLAVDTLDELMHLVPGFQSGSVANNLFDVKKSWANFYLRS